MSFSKVFSAATLAAGALAAGGAEIDTQPAELRQQLKVLQLKLEQSQQDYQKQIQDLQNRLSTLEQASQGTNTALGLSAITNSPAGGEVSPPGSSGPLRFQKNNAYMDIGLSGTIAMGTSTTEEIGGDLELGAHDPNQRGFTLQGLEANFRGGVDPYFRGNANLLFAVDAEGDSVFELEEAWLETVSLPADLQLRMGQLLTEFGRQNPLHLHSWAFVDSPIVSARFLGPDGLRNPGARVSWLTPTPFFSEVLLSLQSSQGDTAAGFRSDGGHSHGSDEDGGELPFAYRHSDNDRGLHSFEDLLLSPRYALSFDLTENQVVLLGASAALGPNSSGMENAGETLTQIYGLDFTWKWKSPRHHGGFPFVAFQTEVMMRRYEAGAFDWDENGDGLAQPSEVADGTTGLPAFLEAETLTDYGFYSQLQYGFRKGWVAGLRFDYSAGSTANYEKQSLTLEGEELGRDPSRAQRWRVSPNLTWHPSEFSKIRLQYNYDDRLTQGVDHSVWLQFEFLLGAHGAHRF